MTVNYKASKTLAATHGPDNTITTRHSTNLFVGGQGDEIADKTESFKLSSAEIKSTSYNFYEHTTPTDTLVTVRADGSISTAPLQMTVTYKGSKTLAATDGPDNNITNRQSKT